MKTKLTVVALILAMLMVLAGGCSADTDRQATQAPATQAVTAAPATAAPATQEPVTKALWVQTTPAGAQFPDGVDIMNSPWFDYIEQATGFDLTWTLFKSGSDYNEQIMLMLAGGNAPDFIQNARDTTLASLCEAGAIAALDDSYEQYAVNFKEIFNTDEVLSLCKIDGTLYYLTRYTGGAAITSVAVRTDILDALGLPTPVSLTDFHDTLAAVKQAYPDMIPLVVSGDISRMMTFATACGVPNDRNLQFYFKDGKVEYPMLTDAGASFIQMMHDWYAEGLLDEEFAIDTETVQKMIAGQGFMMEFNYVEMTRQMAAFQEKNPDGVLEYIEPPVGGNGEQGYLAQPPAAMAWFVPMIHADKTDLAIQFLDACQQQDVEDAINWGFEDEHYTLSGDEHTLTDAAAGINYEYRGYYSRIELTMEWDTVWQKTSGADTYYNYADQFKFTNEILYTPINLENYSKYNSDLRTLVTNEVIRMIVDGFDQSAFDALKAEFLSGGGQAVLDELQAWYDATY